MDRRTTGDTTTMGTREDIYDNEVSPLMKQVLEICKRAEIPLVASFRIDDGTEGDEPLFCTSILPDDTSEHMQALARLAEPPRAHFAAFTITTSTPSAARR